MILSNLYKKLSIMFIMRNSSQPLIVVLILTILLQNLILSTNSKNLVSNIIIFVTLLLLIINVKIWKNDLYKGNNFWKFNKKIIVEYELGFWLFLLSEFAIFAALFWGLFHYSINPSEFINMSWNTTQIENIDWRGISLLNTSLLVFSSLIVNLYESQYEIIKNKKIINYTLIISITMGAVFITSQFVKFSKLVFNINNSVNSNIFYSLTGLHLTHVLMEIFLLILVQKKEFKNF